MYRFVCFKICSIAEDIEYHRRIKILQHFLEPAHVIKLDVHELMDQDSAKHFVCVPAYEIQIVLNYECVSFCR